MTNRQASRQWGFALLIVLWTLGFLALLGTRIVSIGHSDTLLAENLKQRAVLEAAADGAVSQVMFSISAVRDPHVQPDGGIREIQIGQSRVLVRMENEGDRINLNTASAALLRALVIQVGGTPAVAIRVAAAVLDWRTEGTNPRQSVARDADYRAAGRSYGPPESPFHSVEELTDVLGMTPALFARMEPHLTVLTDRDPDMSTRDPLVARALADVAGVGDVTLGTSQTTDQLLRINVTAIGEGHARYSIVVVASADFQTAAPRVKILLRESANQ